MKSTVRLALALFAFAALSLSALAQQSPPIYVRSEIEVTLKPHRADRDVAAQLSLGYGKVMRFLSKDRFVLGLDPSVELKDALASLKKRQSVAKLEPRAPEMPPGTKAERSYSKLSRTMDQYREAYLAYAEAVGIDVDEEIPGLDFFEAYKQWVEERAYPNDMVDVEAMREAALERKALQEFPRPMNSGTLGNWTFLGPTNLNVPYTIYYGQRAINGRVTALAIDPNNSNILWMGAANGGVWKTTNGGTTWTPLGDDWALMGVSAIEIDPNDSDTVYVGTGDAHGFDTAGFGIRKTTDGGATWNTYGAVQFGAASITGIEVDPSNSNNVVAVAGRTGSGRVSNSTDGGLTWTNQLTGGSFLDLSIGTTTTGGAGSTILYAATQGSSVQIWRSLNFGATWAAVTDPSGSNQSAIGVAASKVFDDVVYVLLTNGNDIVKSTNAGTSWSSVSAGFPDGNASLGANYNWSQDTYDFHIETSWVNNGGLNDVVYVGLIDIVQSMDGGANWDNIGGGLGNPTYSGSAITHNDQHCMAVNPSNPQDILVGNDGGVHRATINPATGAPTWDTTISANLGISQFYEISVHPSNIDYVKGGTQDNATPHSFGNLSMWENPGAGDGAGNAINPFNPNFQYNSVQFQTIRRTTSAYGGGQSTIANSGTFSGQSIPFIGDIELDPNNGRYLYANTNYLNRWDENTDTWTTQLGGQLLSSGSRVVCMSIAPGDSNTIYTGSADGELWVSRNFGATWTQIDENGSGGLPDRAYTSIAINPLNSNDVVVAIGGTGTDHVYRCTNTAAGTPVWTSVDNGLPDLQANDVKMDPEYPTTHWYVAMDIGVYCTDDGGASWDDMTQPLGLPNTQANDLAWNQVGTNNNLYVGTFGRGMWRISYDRPSPSALSVADALIEHGDTTTATLTIDQPAADGGTVVNLSSNRTQIVVPATVTVPAGNTTVNFTVSTNGTLNATATITATAAGTNASTGIQVVAGVGPSALGISPRVIFSGSSTTGTVTLNSAAPTGGQVVNLSSNDPNTTVPASITIPAGQTTGNFNITTNQGDRRVAIITASSNSQVRYAAVIIIGFWTQAPGSVSFSGASQVGGDPLSNLLNDDAATWSWKTDNRFVQSTAEWTFADPTGGGSIRGAYLDWRHSWNRNDVAANLEVFNNTTGTWQWLGYLTSATSETLDTRNLTSRWGDYKDGSNNIRVRIRIWRTAGGDPGPDPTQVIDQLILRVRN